MAAKVMGQFDLAVIGSGIVGLATARHALARHPKLKVCVVEKDLDLSLHQTRLNSGVVHAGIYYKKKSLKSQFCIKGSKLIEKYCIEKNLPFKKCGKLIVATDDSQLETLHNLFNNAKTNHIEGVELINGDKIKSIQPGCDKALEAIWSANTAIVDWRQIALSYADDFVAAGGKLITDYQVIDFTSDYERYITLNRFEKDQPQVQSKAVVNCAGLFSDYLARKTNNSVYPKVIPIKGRYFKLSDKLSQSIKTNIYPVPDPNFPFLGIHLTPRIDGEVLIGPTALVTYGYQQYAGERPKIFEMYDIFSRAGFWNMLKDKANFRAGLKELRKFVDHRAVMNEAALLYPAIRFEDIIPIDFCGIRAQVVAKNGKFLDDFIFESASNSELSKVLHVRNCPSPAATSSLAIAERIVNMLEERYI